MTSWLHMDFTFMGALMGKLNCYYVTIIIIVIVALYHPVSPER